MPLKFSAPPGMKDLFEEDLECLKRIEKVCEDVGDFYGFKRIETPFLEFASLFKKAFGESSLTVQKQLFILRTKVGDLLCLRPEGNVCVVRAYLQNELQNFPKPLKVWYFGPFFQQEKTEEGIYHQFYQFGFEVLGSEDPAIEVEIVQVLLSVLKALKLKNLTVEINSFGDSQCRPYYKRVLMSYLKSQRNCLCLDCKRQLRENPFSIFNCKKEKCQRVANTAPQLLDHLCKDCHTHFKNVLELIDGIGLNYQLNPYLFKSEQYYTRTVFEIVQQTPQQTKEILGGGGRYDELVKILGGKQTPGCGASCKVDKIIEGMREEIKKKKQPKQPQIFLAQVGELAKIKAMKIFEEFRKAKIKIHYAFWRNSLSEQLQLAHNLKTRFVLIIGQKEALEDRIIVRDTKTGKQKIILMKKVVQEMKKLLK